MTPNTPEGDWARTWIGGATRDGITVAGRDLPADIMGKLTLTELAYLLVTRREPTPAQTRVLDAVLVSLFLGDPKANGTFLGMVSANGIDAGTPTHTWQVLPMPDLPGEFPMYAQIAGEEAKPAGLTVRLTQ